MKAKLRKKPGLAKTKDGKRFTLLPSDMSLMQSRLLRCETFFEASADGLEEFCGCNGLRLDSFHEVHKVFSHYAGVEGIEACCFKFVAEDDEFLEAVHFAALAESTAP